MRIGVIGQGFVGFNLANALGDVVRYSLEPEYSDNAPLIKNCDIVFVCVPTPTRGTKQDLSIIRSVLPLVSSVAVIKSTVLPGTTRKLQEEFPDIIVMHSPEFLREKTAELDTKFPERNIIGICKEGVRSLAEKILEVLPAAPISEIVGAEEAETVKYMGNTFLTMKVVFSNAFYDFCRDRGIDYATVARLTGKDSRIGDSHMKIQDGGRGAGGHCFPKDLAAIVREFASTNTHGVDFFESMQRLNFELLKQSGKDTDIVKEILN